MTKYTSNTKQTATVVRAKDENKTKSYSSTASSEYWNEYKKALGTRRKAKRYAIKPDN